MSHRATRGPTNAPVGFRLTIRAPSCRVFRWENTGKDLLKCRQCGAAVCVAFDPRLDEASRERLCQKYVGMLASSHECDCPFRSAADRWSKMMARAEGCERRHRGERTAEGRHPDAVDLSHATFYVPPYLLSFLEDLLRFEDGTSDGRLTRRRVRDGALRTRETLRARTCGKTTFDFTMPAEVTGFCRAVHPGVNMETLLGQDDDTLAASYLLSAFGWTPGAEMTEKRAGAMVRCDICHATAWLSPSVATEKVAARKRRRLESPCGAPLQLLDSHRPYCPYVAGFARGPGDASEAGWKVVVSNLLKSCPPASTSNTDFGRGSHLV